MTDGENRQKPQDNMYIVYDYEGFVDLRLPVNRKLYPSNTDFFCNILFGIRHHTWTYHVEGEISEE